MEPKPAAIKVPEFDLLNKTCPYVIPSVTVNMVIATVVTSILSITGALFIFSSYHFIQKIRNTPRLMLCYLTIADVITCMSNMIAALVYFMHEVVQAPSTESNCVHLYKDLVCKSMGALTVYSTESSYLWTIGIAIYLFVCVVKQAAGDYTWLVRMFHIISWGFPGVILISAASSHALGSDMILATGPWCWISRELKPADRVAWMVATILVWELFTYITTVSLYMILKYKVWERNKRGENCWEKTLSFGEILRNADENFTWVPLVVIGTRIWGTIRVLMACYMLLRPRMLTVPPQVDLWLLYSQCIGNNGQALFNSILFCIFDRDVRANIFSREIPHEMEAIRQVDRENEHINERQAFAIRICSINTTYDAFGLQES